MKWTELVSSLENNISISHIAVQAISEPLASSGSEARFPGLNVRLFHDNSSCITGFSLPESNEVQSVHPGFLIAPNSSIRKVASILEEKPFVLILEEDRTERIVCWQDLNRPACSSWLFSQISLFEMMFKIYLDCIFKLRRIEEQKEWQEFLNPNQRIYLLDSWSKLAERNSETKLTDALTFSHLQAIGTRLIAAGQFVLTKEKKVLKSVLAQMSEFRNATAHARQYIRTKQDLVTFKKTLSNLKEYNEKLAGFVDVLEGYESAYYVVENAEFVVSAGDCLPAGKKSMCFITSENPGGQQFSAKENEVRQLELMSDLRLSGVQFSEARSYDPSGKWMEENQFCVMDADFQVMKELALKYNQRTIFWADINEPFGTVILDYTV